MTPNNSIDELRGCLACGHLIADGEGFGPREHPEGAVCSYECHILYFGMCDDCPQCSGDDDGGSKLCIDL